MPRIAEGLRFERGGGLPWMPAWQRGAAKRRVARLAELERGDGRIESTERREGDDGEEHPDYIKNEKGERDTNIINDKALMHRFYGAVVVDCVSYRVMTLMREDRRFNEGNAVHAYEVQKIEVLDEETPNTSNGVGTLNSELEGYPLAKVINSVEKSYDSGKQILTRAKLPMRVVICTVTRTRRRIYGLTGAWGLTSR